MSSVADAAYATVHDYKGGCDALGPRVGITPRVLNSKVLPTTSSHHLSLDEAVRIMAVTGDHRILQAICRHLGYLDPIRAVVYEGIADQQLLELIAAVHSETGDVSRSLVAALTDGRVTEREFEQFDEQVIEAQTALAELRDRLRGMVVPESTLRRVR